MEARLYMLILVEQERHFLRNWTDYVCTCCSHDIHDDLVSHFQVSWQVIRLTSRDVALVGLSPDSSRPIEFVEAGKPVKFICQPRSTSWSIIKILTTWQILSRQISQFWCNFPTVTVCNGFCFSPRRFIHSNRFWLQTLLMVIKFRIFSVV